GDVADGGEIRSHPMELRAGKLLLLEGKRSGILRPLLPISQAAPASALGRASRARARSGARAVRAPGPSARARRRAAARHRPRALTSPLVDDDLDAAVASLAGVVVVGGDRLVLPVPRDDALLVGDVAVLDEVVQHGHRALDREIAVRLPLRL